MFRRLPGCAQDALEIVQWLLSSGVQAGRIRVNVAPPVNSPPSWPAGIVPRAATRQDVWDSITLDQEGIRRTPL